MSTPEAPTGPKADLGLRGAPGRPKTDVNTPRKHYFQEYLEIKSGAPGSTLTISVPGVPNPAGTVPKASSESLEAQNGARAPSKKLGVQERQYSVADIRQMMRLKLTGQARSARLAAEQVGIPTATTALKRFLAVIRRKTELVRAYFAFKSVENSYCRR